MQEKKQEKTPEQLIKEKLLELLNDVRFNAEDRIRNTGLFKEIVEIKDIDLPKHINNYRVDSPGYHILTCRLSGEDPFEKNLSLCLEILYDESFEMEEYRNIGNNDGRATVLSILFDVLGMEKESIRAIEAVYSVD